jgi:ADP-ribosyl-[dinitrogen reductase] hydrolase
VSVADALDRSKGSLLGLAAGDALGTALEFSVRDRSPRVTELNGGGPFDLPPGVWTDDTSMALCLADSLLAKARFDPADVMDRFLRWQREGENSPIGRCFDIGNATAGALRRCELDRQPFAGDPSPRVAGNGSLMRLTPVVIFAQRDPQAAVTLAREQSRLTHAAPEAVDACAFFATLLVEALSGGSPHDILAPRPWAGTPAVAAIAGGSWRGKARSDISSSGYVIHTLEAALWCVGRRASFEDAVIEAANLADDADTVAAVTGQLAGALHGIHGIPARWLDRLAWRERIERSAAALHASAFGERG